MTAGGVVMLSWRRNSAVQLVPIFSLFFLKALFLVMKDKVKQDSFISEWFTSHLRVKCL